MTNHTNHTTNRKSLTTAAAIIAALAGTAFAQSDLSIIGRQQVPYVDNNVQDFFIPLNDPPPNLFLGVLGADGGDAERSQCFRAGGSGATASGLFSVGFGSGQLHPGGVIRFIIGERGQDGSSAGGGGGGSAVLYQAPNDSGELCDDWTILLTAGAGGGAHADLAYPGLTCFRMHAGGNGRVGTAGGAGGGGVPGGRNGEGGHKWSDSGGDGGGGAYTGGGGGAQPGCPTGGSGGRYGAWGFGAGGEEGEADGYTRYGGGGGGGYSGGGGGKKKYEGGGGGSYVSDLAARPVVTKGSSGYENGHAWYEFVDLNETCEMAFPITFQGTVPVPLTFASASGAQASCRTNTGPDLFYAYTPECREDIIMLITPNGEPTTVSVTEGCSGDEVACHWGHGNQFPVAWTGEPGTEYIIRVANDEGRPGTPFLQGFTEAVPPLNDFPVDAVQIDDQTVSVTGTTCSAFPDVTANCDGNWGLTGDVWYEITNTDQCTQYLHLAGWSDDFVVSSHRSDLSEIDCGTNSQLEIEIPGGATRYIRVAGEGFPHLHNGLFTFNLDFTSEIPANDDPETAFTFLPGDVLADRFCDSDYGDFYSSCSLESGAVWYKYPNFSESCETIEFVWSPNDGTTISIHDPSTFEMLPDQCSDTGVMFASVPAGEWLLIRVGGAPFSDYNIVTAISSEDTDGDGISDGCDQCPGADDLADCDNNLIGDCSELNHPGRFEDFSGQGQMAYRINDNSDTNSKVVNGILRLTQAQPMELGSVVFEPVTDQPTASFNAEFDFQIGRGTGAEGVSFVVMDATVHDETALFGETGLGAGSLTIALDTFIGNAQNGNHARLFWDGNEIATEEVQFPLDIDLMYHAEVEFDGSNLTMTLRSRLTGQTTLVFDNTPVPGFTPFHARYGLGARTSDETNRHRVDNIRFTDTSNTNDDDGDGIINPCDQSCYADFNDDGDVNTLDVLAFLNAWNANDTAADCNEDGSINTLDVLCFLNLWNAGC